MYTARSAVSSVASVRSGCLFFSYCSCSLVVIVAVDFLYDLFFVKVSFDYTFEYMLQQSKSYGTVVQEVKEDIAHRIRSLQYFIYLTKPLLIIVVLMICCQWVQRIKRWLEMSFVKHYVHVFLFKHIFCLTVNYDTMIVIGVSDSRAIDDSNSAWFHIKYKIIIMFNLILAIINVFKNVN